jgi:predicted nuclease of predicted toxin-antitoxin system
MADRIRFHLDEHVDPAIATALHRAGVDVTTTIEAGLRAKNDQTHLEFARAGGRVIVTRDQDFLRFAASTKDHAGIVFYTAGHSMREVIEGLILLYEVMTPHEMVGHVEYIG